MSTHSPKAMTAALAQHWDVMERLCAHSREVGTFELEEIERVIARAFPTRTSGDHAGVLQDLSDRGLVQRLPRSDRRRVHPDVLTYVQRLTRERDLGLSGIIKVRIDSIHAATATLQEATEQVNRSGMVAAARQLWQQFDDIGTQLDQDRHAILEVAERAKAMDPSLPLAVRYHQVLEAYDQYVDPMVAMMDSGPGGIFHKHLLAAGDALDAAVQVLITTHGHLVTETRILRDAAYQARELRRLGREVMQHCTSTLLPLRNEIREHSTLAAAVGTVLGLVRKKGAKRVLTTARLPVAVREAFHKITAGPELINLMAVAKNYQPPIIEFPEESEGNDGAPLDVVDLASLRAGLEADGGADDLLAWVSERNPDWQDVTILSAFHALAQRDDGKAVELSDSRSWLDLKTIRVGHHPVVVRPAKEDLQ
ncbi:hypothetical protein [Luteimonas sp. MHLX1A]|uniref:hypothetical protein n=1 Tax=Alterluteimonas muca TaxID=2878684 RepID=UPI001E528443|nr:hypothetical protein [Luteimonas sp. MHLX1A]MCD9046858.1 hypothetical protein [Luteimonas sp. MHLX1A]